MAPPSSVVSLGLIQGRVHSKLWMVLILWCQSLHLGVVVSLPKHRIRALRGLGVRHYATAGAGTLPRPSSVRRENARWRSTPATRLARPPDAPDYPYKYIPEKY